MLATKRDYGINICEWGAIPDSGTDCTDIFESALQTGRSVLVPAGTYIVSRPLSLMNQNLVGEGILSTRIISRCPDPWQPVIRAVRSCRISDIGFGFDEGILTGQEKRGERVGLLTGNDGMPLQRGSALRNVRIEETGTAIYSTGPDSCESFSVTYDALEICDFIYRGFDFCANNRTGNVYSNIYLHSRYDVDCLFNLETCESETNIIQLNVEHTRCRTAVRLVGIRALHATSIHMEGITLTQPGSSFLFLEGTAGTIENMSVYYSSILAKNCRLVTFGDTLFDIRQDWAWYYPDNLHSLTIGCLHLSGLNDPARHIYPAIEDGLHNAGCQGFLFFCKEETGHSPLYLAVENYVWYTFKQDEDVYLAMPSAGDIVFRSKNQLPRFGPTEQLPDHFLCPYYTRYYDTTSQQELLWTGDGWKPLSNSQ